MRRDAVSASHTIPLTVTAEQGIVGLALYIALLAAALRAAALRRPRRPVPRLRGGGLRRRRRAHVAVRGVPGGPGHVGAAGGGDVAGGGPARQRCTRYPCCRPGGIRLIVASSPVQGKPARSATMREGTLSCVGQDVERRQPELPHRPVAQEHDRADGHAAAARRCRDPVADLAAPARAVDVHQPDRADEGVRSSVIASERPTPTAASARAIAMYARASSARVGRRDARPARDLRVPARRHDRRDVALLERAGARSPHR